mgnify:CR=1 FL=1
MTGIAQSVDSAVRNVCPRVEGVSIGKASDKTTWRVDFTPEATLEDREAVAVVLAGFNINAPSVEMIVAERTRRLSLGFNYNFGDARGIHRIGTTPADLAGWDEVSKYAGVLIDSGDTSTLIAIVTDTGPCTVTAPEWRAIEIEAAHFRQPLWAKSFALMANPPADYTNDSHWS